MPKFSGNIGDGWLYPNILFYDRFNAAKLDGFKYIECGNPYNYDPNIIKSLLLQNNLKFTLINTHTFSDDKLPVNRDKNRLFHAIYHDERELFNESIKRALTFANIVECPNIHIDIGKLTDDMKQDKGVYKQAFNVLISNLKNAQKMADDMDKDGRINLVIEPVNDIKGRGIENYFLWDYYYCIEIIDIVNKDYNGKHPIKMQFDFYHFQTKHGDVISFLKKYIQYIQYIQVSQVPYRNEACNDVTIKGELNYNYLYSMLDNELQYNGYVGLEYHPNIKNKTSNGLKLDNNWFKRFNDIKSKL